MATENALVHGLNVTYEVSSVLAVMYCRSVVFSTLPWPSRKFKDARTSLRVIPCGFSSLQMLKMPREFYPQLDLQVAEEAFHILELRNLIMRATDYQNKYQLTSLGKSTDVADIFEKTLDQAFLSEISQIIDSELSRSCLNKSYEDAITSAFSILEVRVRTRINAGPERIGTDLMDDAFHPDRGRLVFGETPSERQAVHQTFRSAYMMLRNPPSHRHLEEFGGAEIVEIILFVDFLLKILTKATDRTS